MATRSFCEHVRAVLKLKKVTMTLEHHPGDVMMMDFADDRLPYVDPKTGELYICEVLVCILPHSGSLVSNNLFLLFEALFDSLKQPS